MSKGTDRCAFRLPKSRQDDWAREAEMVDLDRSQFIIAAVEKEIAANRRRRGERHADRHLVVGSRPRRPDNDAPPPPCAAVDCDDPGDHGRTLLVTAGELPLGATTAKVPLCATHAEQADREGITVVTG